MFPIISFLLEDRSFYTTGKLFGQLIIYHVVVTCIIPTNRYIQIYVVISIKLLMEITRTDLPTCYEIKAEDLPPFGKKTRKIFLLGKYSDIFICR